MNVTNLDVLLLQEMENVKGGAGTCICGTGAGQGAEGLCKCNSGAAQNLIKPEPSCACTEGGAGQVNQG